MTARQVPVRFTMQPTLINEYIAPAVHKFCWTIIHHRIPEEIRQNDNVLAKIFYKCLLEAVKDDIIDRRKKYQSEISELLLSVSGEERTLLERIFTDT